MNKSKPWILSFLVLIFLLVAGAAYAQTGSGYDLSWSTVDGGGDTLTGGGYTLNGAAGQPDAGTTMTGSGYSLTGGFWPAAISGGGSSSQSVYLPVVLKNSSN